MLLLLLKAVMFTLNVTQNMKVNGFLLSGVEIEKSTSDLKYHLTGENECRHSLSSLY